MKAENRIAINGVYGTRPLIDEDVQSALMNNVQKALRAFSRKNKIKRILNKNAAN